MKVITWQDPKTVFVPPIEHKNSPIGPQKVKTTPKLSQNQVSELKETKKMIIIALYEQTAKQFALDMAQMGLHDVDSNYNQNVFFKIQSKSSVRIEGNIENESCLTT